MTNQELQTLKKYLYSETDSADEIKQLEKQQSDLEAKEMMGEEDYARLAELKTQKLQKDQRFDQLSSERDKLALTIEDLAKVIEPLAKFFGRF